MRNVLLYCPSIAGHRLEYINHLCFGVSKHKEINMIVAVPSDFKNLRNNLVWPDSPNISFIEIDENYTDRECKSNLLKRVICRCKGLQHYVKTTAIENVLVLDLMEYNPILPLFLKKSCKVSGIIYNIYLYEDAKHSLCKRILNKFKYVIFSSFKVWDKIFILNDEISVPVLNKKYKTNKFKFLPDPVVRVEKTAEIDIRERYGVSKEKTILLHPGGMMAYKGTIEILKAFEILPQNVCKNFAIVFAGRVTKEISDEFHYLRQRLEKKVQIVIEGGFLPYDYLGAFFKYADWILIPYKIISQSSGILGLSAFFQKPVIATKGGIIGNNVEKYKLGILVQKSTPEDIAAVLLSLPQMSVAQNTYADNHTIDSFNSIILDKYIG